MKPLRAVVGFAFGFLWARSYLEITERRHREQLEAMRKITDLIKERR